MRKMLEGNPLHGVERLLPPCPEGKEKDGREVNPLHGVESTCIAFYRTYCYTATMNPLHGVESRRCTPSAGRSRWNPLHGVERHSQFR